MELRVNEVTLPEAITFNYEELKKELTEKVSIYETMVYTDDQIKEAKADKANLNKLKKALNDERIRREKEYMLPFNDFKAKINEIIGIIDKPVAVIDKQVKEYEEKQKQDKLDKITIFFNESTHPEWLHMSQIFNEKWLNASTSMKSIQEDIIGSFGQITTDLATLSNLPEFGFEATEVYKSTLDINKALNEGKRLSEIAKAKAAHEAEMKAREEAEKAKINEIAAEVESFGTASAAEVEEAMKHIEEFENDMKLQNKAIVKGCEMAAQDKQWISFSALLSTEDAFALKGFFDSRNIEFKENLERMV